MLARVALVFLVAGCCGEQAPEWGPLEAVAVAEDERVTLDLAAHVVDDGATFSFTAVAGNGVLAHMDGAALSIVASPGFTGESEIALTVEDACGNLANTTLPILVGGAASACPTSFRYEARGDADQVFVAGEFNAWEPRATPLTRGDDGAWTVDVDIAPGAWPYKFVEANFTDGTEQWACDPEAAYAQCDQGYTWDEGCPLDAGGCNSLVRVADCSLPVLSVGSLAVDREADTISLTVDVTGAAAATDATLDGQPLDGWDGARFTWSGTLSDGRHTFRFHAQDASGREAEELYVPVWLDDRDWSSGLMYYVFVDRFANSDTSLDVSEGTSVASTDYAGGDWQGVVDRLDYLDDLGVTVLWLTAPQDNAAGAFDGSCGASYSGYHGYWPADPFAPEEHFGDTEALHALIDAAHDRNMRVLTDWVGNHVHSDHPYYRDHPEWFNAEALCGDANNWNDIPETCWFDSFLPDVRYYDVEPLEQMVDDAMVWAKEYELDGYRVDAVKHMPHAVFFNFATRSREELEHGVEDFYTVGETYSGDRGLISAYVDDRQLDGQFDFPLYWAIVAAFARDEIGLSAGDGSLESVYFDSRTAFDGHLMSTFLGNHDVARFLAMATGEISSLYGDSSCGDDGLLRTPDLPATGWAEPYERLALAWSFLLTTEGLPLVYYGDEIGLPGYNDPDNRQPMRFDDELSAEEARVLAHVQALGQARRDHPAFSRGTWTEWWGGETAFWGYARVTEDDAVLVLLNRGDTSRTVSNGLAFAGLSQGTYRDVSGGGSWTSSGDTLTVDVPAMGSLVLVRQ